MFMVVVLPAPFGPRRPKSSPVFTVKEMWSTAVNPLNNLSKEKVEQLLSKAYYYGYFGRGWRDTMLRIYKRKGIRLFLNPRNLHAMRDILNFFKDIRRMKRNKDSISIQPIRFN